MRRVAVTGLGLVTPLGVGLETNWQRLTAGASGVRAIIRFPVDDLPAQIAGMVPGRDTDDAGFDAEQWLSAKDRRKMDLFIQYAIAASAEALAQAGWAPDAEAGRQRTGVIIASGVGGFPAMMAGAAVLQERGVRRISPFLVPSFLANLAAGQVSIRHGFRGPLGTPVTACAASVQAIGDAARLIRDGEADVMVAGGAEACVERLSLAGFGAAQALSTRFNDAPETASRPFDRQRDGFVMAEGAGSLVLEDWDHAAGRGATILAEVAGYGTTADGYHITSPPEGGEGSARAMRLALEQAGCEPGDIGYINAHSTSTPAGDAAEVDAVRNVFAGSLGTLAMSSTKSAIGHLLGAAGAVETIYTVLALRHGVLPPTLNLHDPEFDDLDLVPLTAKPKAMDWAMSNGFGFGGVNASVVLRRTDG